MEDSQYERCYLRATADGWELKSGLSYSYGGLAIVRPHLAHWVAKKLPMRSTIKLNPVPPPPSVNPSRARFCH